MTIELTTFKVDSRVVKAVVDLLIENTNSVNEGFCVLVAAMEYIRQTHSDQLSKDDLISLLTTSIHAHGSKGIQ